MLCFLISNEVEHLSLFLFTNCFFYSMKYLSIYEYLRYNAYTNVHIFVVCRNFIAS